MPRLRFNRFSDLEFIQSINKPEYFQPLLAGFEDYFTRQGLDVTTLKNDDDSDRKLHKAFTQPAEEFPPALLETLFVLDDLADEPGHDRIHDEAGRSNTKLDGIADDLTAGEFAIAVYQHSPALIHACHEKTVYRKIRNYLEFQARTNARLTLATARKACRRLEKTLASWFEARDRSAACEIYVYKEDHEIKFLITHGRIFHTQGTFDKDLTRSRVAFRPQKHDSVIFDNQTRVLRVNAQTSPEKECYRRIFGDILFGDAEHFPAGDIYTLEPLRRGKRGVKLVDGVKAVRLREVWVGVSTEQKFVQISKAYDLFTSIEADDRPSLAEGQILRAAFLMEYASGGHARRLEIRPPNIAIHDRDRDGIAAESFLRANEYLKVKQDDDAD